MIFDQSILQTKTAKYLVNIIKLLLNKRTRDMKETTTAARQAVKTFTRADDILMKALKKRRKTDPNDRRGRRL